MVVSIVFGVGIAMVVVGYLMKPKTSRFNRSMQKNILVDSLRPLTYLQITRYLAGKRKSLSLTETEELVAKAGRPWGIEAKDIMLARIVLPILAVIISLSIFSLRVLFQAIQQLRVVDGVAIKKITATGMPVLIAIGAVILGYYAPYVVLRLLISIREKQIMSEQKLFSEILFMSLRANLSLREALEEAGKTTTYLQPYIKKCLNDWLADKTKALIKMRRDVGIPSFQIIIDLLIQAVEIGDENIHKFLEENTVLEEELKNIEIASKSKLRPVIGTVQMILPFTLMMFVLFYPLVEYLQDLFMLF